MGRGMKRRAFKIIPLPMIPLPNMVLISLHAVHPFWLRLVAPCEDLLAKRERSNIRHCHSIDYETFCK